METKSSHCVDRSNLFWLWCFFLFTEKKLKTVLLLVNEDVECVENAIESIVNSIVHFPIHVCLAQFHILVTCVTHPSHSQTN